ncbi:DEKNAAC100751 [Brettanomyces naardenensis]|uniref:DEKNAAC100751 n=1 Tax=Brettanomyces naardenensis TaxID=13370 RepID=A0A448YFC3_BRENA|nr:DEKNAAC100751 [Brettanomyces naardenensis]
MEGDTPEPEELISPVAETRDEDESSLPIEEDSNTEIQPEGLESNSDSSLSNIPGEEGATNAVDNSKSEDDVSGEEEEEVVTAGGGDGETENEAGSANGEQQLAEDQDSIGVESMEPISTEEPERLQADTSVVASETIQRPQTDGEEIPTPEETDSGSSPVSPDEDSEMKDIEDESNEVSNETEEQSRDVRPDTEHTVEVKTESEAPSDVKDTASDLQASTEEIPKPVSAKEPSAPQLMKHGGSSESRATESSVGEARSATEGPNTSVGTPVLSSVADTTAYSESSESRATVPMSALKKQTHTIVLPSYASWFDLKKIHKIEKESLPEFFNHFNKNKSPEIYARYRNFMINAYRLNPNDYLSFTAVRRNLVGDAPTLLRVHRFLDKWGLINYQVNPETRSVPIEPPYTGDFSVDYDTPRGMFPFEGYRPPTELPDLSKVKQLLDNRPNLEKRSANDDGEAPKKKVKIIKPDVNKGWSEDSLKKLIDGVKIFSGNWYKVAELVGNKTPEECIIRFLQLPMEDEFLQEHKELLGPLKYVPNLSFSPNDNPVMSTLAFLSKMVDPEVAAAASNRSIKIMDEKIDEKINSNKPKYDKDSKGDDALADIKDAAANAFGIIGSKSHLFATYEEREMNKSFVNIIQNQLKIVELKLSKLNALEKEYEFQRKQLSSKNDEMFLEKLSLFKYTDSVSTKLLQAIDLLEAVLKTKRETKLSSETSPILAEGTAGQPQKETAEKNETPFASTIDGPEETAPISDEENDEQKGDTDETNVKLEDTKTEEGVGNGSTSESVDIAGGKVEAEQPGDESPEGDNGTASDQNESEVVPASEQMPPEQISSNVTDDVEQTAQSEAEVDLEGDIDNEKEEPQKESLDTRKSNALTSAEDVLVLSASKLDELRRLIREARDVVLKPPRKQLNILETETQEEPTAASEGEDSSTKPVSFEAPQLYRYWSG